jgi:hypothetical protein
MKIQYDCKSEPSEFIVNKIIPTENSFDYDSKLKINFSDKSELEFSGKNSFFIFNEIYNFLLEISDGSNPDFTILTEPLFSIKRNLKTINLYNYYDTEENHVVDSVDDAEVKFLISYISNKLEKYGYIDW